MVLHAGVLIFRILIRGILVCIYLTILVKTRNAFLKQITSCHQFVTLRFALQRGVKSVQTGFFSGDTKAGDGHTVCVTKPVMFWNMYNTFGWSSAQGLFLLHHNSCQWRHILALYMYYIGTCLCNSVFNLFWSFDEAYQYFNFKIY